MASNRQTREFMQREVRAQGNITGMVISKPVLKFFGTGVSETWVHDVAIGSNREIKNVPIKAGSNGSRMYADLGQSVTLQRNGQKFQTIGPGDRVIGITEVKTYTPGVPTPIAETNDGQGFVRRPYSHYQGDLPGTPGSGLYGVQVGYPLIEKVDGDGNVIP